MANKIHYFVPSANRAQAEEELQSVSGSFGLVGTETTTDDVIVGVSPNIPNFKLFNETLIKHSTAYVNHTIDEILADKGKTKKVIVSDDI